MFITYNFKIYYYRNKKNFANSLSRKLNYVINNKRKKENFLKILILERVRFKILIINLS